MKHVLNTTGDFYSDETKKNQVLFLSQLVTKANRTTKTYRHSIYVYLYMSTNGKKKGIT